jgi:UDP-N-acetylmuramate dehydrogenase
MNIRENVALAPLTTLGVGGPSRYLIEARSAEEVVEAARFAHDRKLPLFVLGGGSNLVVSDRGWPGVTLKIDIRGIEESQDRGRFLFRVGAGESWDDFVAHAVSRTCGGIECLSGIPGSVGGTPVQNVGAYGQEVAETIQSVLALNRADLAICELSNVECGFGYRTSIFNISKRDVYIILEVTFGLKPDGQPKLEYADLKKYFASWKAAPTLAEVRDAVRSIRASKGMLIVPGDEDCRSVGSFFKNPVLTGEQYHVLRHRAGERGLQIPSYPALEAHHKVSAAWLVENAGFQRGYGGGPAGISRKHTLAIVNRGEATAADIVALKNEIQQRVLEVWRIELKTEPVFVGF